LNFQYAELQGVLQLCKLVLKRVVLFRKLHGTPDAILQDFYATMFLADLAGVLEYDLREEIEAAHIRPENRYTYKLNVAMTISELKRTVVEMLSTSSRLKRERLYAHMVVRLSKAVVPVRPDRSSDRLKKHKSLKFPSNVKRC